MVVSGALRATSKTAAAAAEAELTASAGAAGGVRSPQRPADLKASAP